MLHKIFISYYHAESQKYKDFLIKNYSNISFIDCSVDTGDINELLPAQTIRQIIRDEFLRDTTVTIVLIGLDTWRRKHIDWEISSSIRNTKLNSRSGLVYILLPENDSYYYDQIYLEDVSERIYDNYKNGYAEVLKWNNLNAFNLKIAIDNAFNKRFRIQPDNSSDLRSRNSET